MPTAGELLAMLLRGNTSITNADIAHATEDFFKQNGVDCTCEFGPESTPIEYPISSSPPNSVQNDKNSA